MSHVYITSDWHIGHTGISERFRKQFPNDNYHDDFILQNMADAVTKRDVLYVIGDATWTLTGLEKIANADISARMILVAGNHDTLKATEYRQVFDDIVGVIAYKKYWITHIPIHPMEMRGRIANIHGHCHRGGPWEAEKDARYFNAILEFNDYQPINMQEVSRIIKERQDYETNNC